jgi:hypothetical protein
MNEGLEHVLTWQVLVCIGGLAASVMAFAHLDDLVRSSDRPRPRLARAATVCLVTAFAFVVLLIGGVLIDAFGR